MHGQGNIKFSDFNDTVGHFLVQCVISEKSEKSFVLFLYYAAVVFVQYRQE
jgi:hypothetical protein